ncbi:MAG: ABC transporter ATP-binding protein, partial [Gemmatimonadaceae bacterium]
SDLLHRRPAQLSGGQRQRVALGRALVREPQVFLFDEPLSNLDAKLRVQMRREIARLHRELGATMVYVTHDQVEAMTLGDRIVVMDRGHVQQVDTPLALYERPANRFVAGFIGTPPMNFLEGVVSGDGTSGLTLELPDVAIRLGGGAPNGRLESLAGRRLVAGIRPEDLALAQAPRPRGSDSIAPLAPMGSDSTATLSGRLELVEPLGGETLLHVALEGGGQPLIVRIVGQQITEVDTSVVVKLDLGKVPGSTRCRANECDFVNWARALV